MLVLNRYNKSKFAGPLMGFSIKSPIDVARLGVPLASISATVLDIFTLIWSTTSDKNIQTNFIPAVLDSGAMLTGIPVSAHTSLLEHLNAFYSGRLFAKTRKGDSWPADIDCRHSSANIFSKCHKHSVQCCLKGNHSPTGEPLQHKLVHANNGASLLQLALPLRSTTK